MGLTSAVEATLRSASVSTQLALDSPERVHGADHRLSVVTADRLADAYLKAGQPAKAVAVLEGAIARAAQGHGADVSTGALRRVRLGPTMPTREMLSTGVKLVEALDSRSDGPARLGTDDGVTLDAQFVLADLYLKLADAAAGRRITAIAVGRSSGLISGLA